MNQSKQDFPIFPESFETCAGRHAHRHECGRGDPTWGETPKELDQQKHQGSVIHQHIHVTKLHNNEGGDVRWAGDRWHLSLHGPQWKCDHRWGQL